MKMGDFNSNLKLDKTLLKNILTTGINISLILLTLNLLSANLYIAGLPIMRIFTTYVMLGFVIFNFPFRKTFKNLTGKTREASFYKTIIGLILIVFSFLLLVFTNSQMIWLISIPITLTGIDVTLQAARIQRKEFFILTFATTAYAMFFILVQTIPFLWYIIQQFSIWFSGLIGSAVGKQLALGPSTSGIWIILVFIIFSIGVFFLTGMKKLVFVLNKIGLFVIWIIYLIFLGVFEFESKSNIVDYHYVLFILCLIPTFLYLIKIKLPYQSCKLPNVKHVNLKLSFSNGAVWAVVLILISTVVLTSFPLADNSDDEEINVLFYGQNMLGSWDVPEYGKYGKTGSGMFGLLPYYANQLNYNAQIVVDNKTEFIATNFPNTTLDINDINLTELLGDNTTDLENLTAQINNTVSRYINFTDYTTIIESDSITDAVLEDVDVFVVINLNVSFTSDELSRIWSFVRNGGSLLVLGDHTDIGGMQDPLNNLLNPVGISYRFDSGLPIDPDFKWMPCYQMLHHPITIMATSLDEIEISVGASLDINAGSSLLLAGRYGLSDIGDRDNEDGAFLGDYEYNEGEQIGDIILAAYAYYGDGRVVVFGDTSAYQNLAIPYSLPFISSVLHWLSSSRTYTLEYAQIIASIVLLSAAVLLYVKFKKQKINFGVFPIIICIGLLISTSINPGLVGSDEIKGDNIIYIDASHNERFNLEAYNDDSLSGLMLNIIRNNYLTIILRDFDKEKIRNSECVIFNAPTTSFTGSEVQFLKQYISDGGVVILATGYDDKQASMPLLNEFGLDIEEIPLGPVPYVEENPEEYQTDPRFVDSWPILIDESHDTEKFYNITISGYEYVLMTFTRNKQWIATDDLEIGDLIGFEGCKIVDITEQNEKTTVYNLKIDKYQNYMVSSGYLSKNILVSSTGSSGFSGDTNVVMYDGTLKNIKDIKVGDMVLTFNEETYKNEFGKVLSIDENSKEQIEILEYDDFNDNMPNQFIKVAPGQVFCKSNGGLLLISDSQFLYDENIESLYDYWPGNIQFTKNIIDELKDRGLLG